MYIGEVVSHLGGWRLLSIQHEKIFDEIKEVLVSQNNNNTKLIETGNYRFSARELSKSISDSFYAKKWNTEVPLNFRTKRIRRRWLIDCLKATVGVEICLGKQAFTESYLFVKLPFYVKVGQIDIAVLLLPMRSISIQMQQGFSSFEDIKDLLIELAPLPLRYPFIVIGICEEETDYIINELTSDLDLYLINKLGYSLEEAVLLGEQANYDFKEQLPENNKLSQEICGFANHLNGGLILLGLNDDGDVVGVDIYKLDEIKLKVTNIIRSTCNPIPKIEYNHFYIPECQGKAILVVQVSELEAKPCVVAGRVYIRVGPSVRIASPEEIRSMILR